MKRQQIGLHLLVGFQGVSFAQELKSLIEAFHIGGIVLFRRNVESPAQLRALIAEAQEYARRVCGRPLWVAIDQEGGPVQRLVPPFTPLPSARELALEGEAAIREWAGRAAAELRQTGIHQNLAPVLDVTVNGEPDFLKARTLGSDPLRVAELGNVWIQALQGSGVSATAKHFPGIGQAESDPHHFAPVIRWADHSAMEKDLLPFRRAIDSGVHAVMTSHALYPLLDSEWPATLSARINQVLLRETLGFQGVLLSDDMDMAAVCDRYSWTDMVRQGLGASMDFFLLCQRPESIEPFYAALCDAIEGSSTLAGCHEASLHRIGKLFERHALK